MIVLIKIVEEKDENILFAKGFGKYYISLNEKSIVYSNNLENKVYVQGSFLLKFINNYFISHHVHNFYEYNESERLQLERTFGRYNSDLQEIDRKKFSALSAYKISGRVFIGGYYPDYSYSIGIDYLTNEEVFCVKKLNWSMSNNLIELFGNYLFYLAEDGLHCQDTKIKKDIWVKPNEILEERCQHFKFLEYAGQMICYNMTDGFVSYNILTGNKNWTWAINPDIYYRYTLSKDGVLHIIADDWYIQLDANNGKEISRFCYWPTVMEMVNNPISKERAGMANPIATNSHLLFGSQGALFLINRETGNIDFLHELEITFRIFPTLDIDENKIIYTCTNNSWQDLKSKVVFLVFEEIFEF